MGCYFLSSEIGPPPPTNPLQTSLLLFDSPPPTTTVAYYATLLGSEGRYIKEAPRIAGMDPFIEYHFNSGQNFYSIFM